MKRILGNAALLATALLVTLFAAERLGAWLLSRPAQPYPRTHFDEGRLVENGNGFRDYDYPREKAPGVFRVLAVGDSFTQGGGVSFDDIWPKRLERDLVAYENVRGVRYQVLNWGRPGASTPSEVAKIRDAAPDYRPDLIVVGYCLNDAEDETNRPALAEIRRKFYGMKVEGGGSVNAFFLEHSALYRLVASRLVASRVNRGYLAYHQALYRDDYQGWRKTRDAFADLARWRAERGVPVVVMIFPLFSWDLGERYPLAGVHAKVHAELERVGLPYLDLLPAYAGLEHRILEAVPFRDPHPSDVAHRIAAEELYLFLRDRGFLKRGEPLAPSLRERRLSPPWG